MSEKRSFSRQKRRLMVQFDSAGSRRTGFTTNLSHTGVFVASAHIPKTGEPVHLTILFGDGRKLQLEGTVVRGLRNPVSLAYSQPSGFCVQLAGYEEEFAKYVAASFRET